MERKKVKRQTLEKKFEDVDTLIIDEVSMVGCKKLAKISRKLNEAKHNDASLAFGGIDVLYFGDFIQFPPIYDFALYTGWNEDPVVYAKTQNDINTQLGIHLWKQLNHIILLDEQMRLPIQHTWNY